MSGEVVKEVVKKGRLRRRDGCKCGGSLRGVCFFLKYTITDTHITTAESQGREREKNNNGRYERISKKGFESTRGKLVVTFSLFYPESSILSQDVLLSLLPLLKLLCCQLLHTLEDVEWKRKKSFSRPSDTMMSDCERQSYILTREKRRSNDRRVKEKEKTGHPVILVFLTCNNIFPS